MVTGDGCIWGQGGAERSLGQLGPHTGQATGGSGDSPPWMCSGFDPWDSLNFHALNKTGAFKNCG